MLSFLFLQVDFVFADGTKHGNTCIYKSCSNRTLLDGNCITVVMNYNEGIIHIVIVGTSQGDGVLEFKNSKGEVVYTQTIKTWNERTDLDIEQTSFVADDYVVSFTSASMKCNSEFSFK